MRTAILALCALLTLTAQTPAPTTSRDCPTPERDTATILASNAVTVAAPIGTLSLIPVATEASRERGLMCVVRMPPGKGMVFVFTPGDRNEDFWMKNTLIALDMIWVAHDGRVTHVAANVPPTPLDTPDDRIGRRDGTGSYVIELGGGDAERHGIKAGVTLALQALTAKE